MIKAILTWLLGLLNKPVPPLPIPPINDELEELLRLINEQRKQITMQPYVINSNLMQAAKAHSDWEFTNKQLTHYGDADPSTRIKATGYKYTTYGENIAYGYPSSAKVFAGWMGSLGHRTNIENGNFREVGLAVTGTYWTAVFASKEQVRGFFNLPEGIVDAG